MNFNDIIVQIGLIQPSIFNLTHYLRPRWPESRRQLGPPPRQEGGRRQTGRRRQIRARRREGWSHPGEPSEELQRNQEPSVGSLLLPRGSVEPRDPGGGGGGGGAAAAQVTPPEPVSPGLPGLSSRSSSAAQFTNSPMRRRRRRHLFTLGRFHLLPAVWRRIKHAAGPAGSAPRVFMRARFSSPLAGCQVLGWVKGHGVPGVTGVTGVTSKSEWSTNIHTGIEAAQRCAISAQV